MLPKNIKIVEVGPRDGLQNELSQLSIEDKINFIKSLNNAGLVNIEVGSFVSEQAVPQMHDTDKVLDGLSSSSILPKGSVYHVLVPNMRGMDKACHYKNLSIAVFTSASESFCQKNINCSISESIERFKPILSTAKLKNIPVRGYVSCVLGCPYEKDIDIKKVVELSVNLIEMGCYEISLGDTIGVGNITQVKKLIEQIGKKIDLNKVAVHFHDTYGQALVNVYAALEMGINIIDSSVAGLGGCPYAKGSAGNLATEDLVYMLEGLNIETGVDLNKIISIGHGITKKLNILPRSKLSLAKLN